MFYEATVGSFSISLTIFKLDLVTSNWGSMLKVRGDIVGVKGAIVRVAVHTLLERSDSF